MTAARVARIVAVNAGLSDPSSTRLLVDRVVAEVANEFGAHGITAQIEIIDLRDLAVAIGESLAAGFATGAVADAIARVQDADALIAATPVFNASYAGLFKSFFDLVDVDEMAGKPVLIAATGGSPRHSLVLDHALRPLFGYLRTVVVPTGIYAASQDWAGESGDTATLDDRIRRSVAELVALVAARVHADYVVAKPDSTTIPVAELSTTDRAEAAGIANFARLLGGSD